MCGQLITTEDIDFINKLAHIKEEIHEGKMIGYRLYPTESKERFEKLGLKYRDHIVMINGVRMDDKEKYLTVLKLSNETNIIELMLFRDNSELICVRLGWPETKNVEEG